MTITIKDKLLSGKVIKATATLSRQDIIDKETEPAATIYALMKQVADQMKAENDKLAAAPTIYRGNGTKA